MRIKTTVRVPVLKRVAARIEKLKREAQTVRTRGRPARLPVSAKQETRT